MKVAFTYITHRHNAHSVSLSPGSSPNRPMVSGPQTPVMSSPGRTAEDRNATR